MKKIIVLSVFAIISITLPSYMILSKNGKAGYTGSPSESSCNYCHNSYPLNSGGGSIKMVTNIPNDMYAPSTTYQISVIVGKPGVSLFGFGCEVLTADVTNVGTFAVTDAVRTQKINAPNGRPNMTHKLDGGAFTDSSVFTFNWTSPATNEGDVTFYYTGVCANENNLNSLDYVYKGSHTITPSPVFSVEEESVFTNLKVFPALDNEWVNVHLTLRESSNVLIDIVGLDGSPVIHKSYIDQQLGEQKYLLPVNHLSAGVYVLKASIGKTSISRKFIVTG